MEKIRGVVIPPGFESFGTNGFTVNTSGVPSMLRHCLLYWDKIEWPTNNLVKIDGGAEIDY